MVEAPFIAFELTTRAYDIKAVANPNFGDDIVAVDALNCRLPVGAATPSCTLTVAGQPIAAPALQANAAEASLFQLFADAGAASIAADGSIVVAGSKLECHHMPGGYEYNACWLHTTPGTAPTPKPVTLAVTANRADSALSTLLSLGLVPPNSHDGQYTAHAAADKISCNAIFSQGDGLNSEVRCDVTGNGKVSTVTAEGGAVSLYRLLAEAGGAAYDDANIDFTAAATQIDCINGNTHEDGVATCTFTLAQRRQVITALAAFSVTGTAFDELNAALAAAKAPTSTNGDLTATSAEALACHVPTLHNEGLDAFTCSVKLAGQAPSTVAAQDGNYAISDVLGALDPLAGARLDPSDLSRTLIDASVRCVASKSEEFPGSCSGYVVRLAPL